MYERTKDLNGQLRKCWTPKMVAEYFGVTDMTVHNWVTRDGMPKVAPEGPQFEERAGNRYFVPQDVKAWAKQRAIKPSKELAA
jgi:hypothetical protein